MDRGVTGKEASPAACVVSLGRACERGEGSRWRGEHVCDRTCT